MPSLNSVRKNNSQYMFGNDLEGFDQWSEVYLSWHMLVSDNKNGPAFRALVSAKFKAVSECTNITGIGMKKID